MFFLGSAHFITYLLIPALLVIGIYFNGNSFVSQTEDLLVEYTAFEKISVQTDAEGKEIVLSESEEQVTGKESPSLRQIRCRKYLLTDSVLLPDVISDVLSLRAPPYVRA